MRRALVAAALLAGCGPTAAHQTAHGPSHRPYRDAPTLPADTPTTTTTTTVARTVTARVSRSRTIRPTIAPMPRRATIEPDCGGWRDLVAGYPWPVDTACRILMCESHGDPNARNRRSGATGLFQILRGGSTDPAANVAQAYAMFRQRGWQPWECR